MLIHKACWSFVNSVSLNMSLYPHQLYSGMVHYGYPEGSYQWYKSVLFSPSSTMLDSYHYYSYYCYGYDDRYPFYRCCIILLNDFISFDEHGSVAFQSIFDLKRSLERLFRKEWSSLAIGVVDTSLYHPVPLCSRPITSVDGCFWIPGHCCTLRTGILVSLLIMDSTPTCWFIISNPYNEGAMDCTDSRSLTLCTGYAHYTLFPFSSVVLSPQSVMVPNGM